MSNKFKVKYFIFLGVLIFTIISIQSCSKKEKLNYIITKKDGIKIYNNKNISSESDLSIIPKLVLKIEGESLKMESSFTSPTSVCSDSKNNIYILNNKDAKVKKFDKSGNYIGSFCNLGQGPGEATDPENMIILNDTIMVIDDEAARIIKFSTDGDYINQSKLATAQIPMSLTPVGENNFIGFILGDEKRDNNYYVNISLILLDLELNIIKTIQTHETKLDPANLNIHDMINPFAIGNNEIFVANTSTDKYEIDVYDFQGIKLYTITKNFIKVKYTNNEKKLLNESLKKNYRCKAGNLTFRKAINTMFCDKNGRLWVNSSIKRDEANSKAFIVDIFDKGIFLKSVKINDFVNYDYLDSDYTIKFLNDKIFVTDIAKLTIELFVY